MGSVSRGGYGDGDVDAAAAFSPEWHDKAVDLLSGPQCAPGHAAKAVGLYFGEVATVERVAAALEKV